MWAWLGASGRRLIFPEAAFRFKALARVLVRKARGRQHQVHVLDSRARGALAEIVEQRTRLIWSPPGVPKT